jgi:EF hand
MNRIVLGAVAALLLVSAGLFWWQGRAATEIGAPPPDPASEEEVAVPGALPSADVRGKRGPAPPEASEATREQRRFARLDRDIDGRITRNEMLSTRTAAFRKLDTDGNNLLTFEEWAVATGNRFKSADRNGDQWLTREEFATTKPKDAPKPKCRC